MCIHTNIYMYIHKCIYTHTFTLMLLCIPSFLFIHTACMYYMQILTYIHVLYTYIHVHTWCNVLAIIQVSPLRVLCRYIHTYIYIYIHILQHTYVCVYTYRYTYINCVCINRCPHFKFKSVAGSGLCQFCGDNSDAPGEGNKLVRCVLHCAALCWITVLHNYDESLTKMCIFCGDNTDAPDEGRKLVCHCNTLQRTLQHASH